MPTTVRVRFAPSPTGYLHIGNVRAALLNYIFAQQNKGSLVLRIEDTDKDRNINEAVYALQKDLAWLGISFDEGPEQGGMHAPYAQSERGEIYLKHLGDLVDMGKVYRCFCTANELKTERELQAAAGKPPRYSRKCLNLADDVIDANIAQGLPFLWRFKVNHDQVVTFNDLARGKVTFEMKHFGDFALTRSDGTYTFAFTNFIDDWLMKITHVIRGEDHLSNTAMQAVLFDALCVPLPTFWHLPIICNLEGKKLSKRDFGFALHDLRDAGFLPEAICNYLAMVGSIALEGSEVASMHDLINIYNFDEIHATGQIKYDVEKLTWFNHQWIAKIELFDLVQHVRPLLHEAFAQAHELSDETLGQLVGGVRTDLKVLNDVVPMLRFYFEPPIINHAEIIERLGEQGARKIQDLFGKHKDVDEAQAFLSAIKSDAKGQGLALRDVFGMLRYVLTGSVQGIGMNDLAVMLGDEEFLARVRKGVDSMRG